MKKNVSAVLAVLMIAVLAVSAAAMIPFPGTDILTVTQDGKPLAGATFDLFRVDRFGDEDTFLGAYTADDAGVITASHLTTGEYYWQDSSRVVKEEFRITGAGFVRSAIDLPTSVSVTVTAEGRELTVTADLSGGYLGEINSYGTLYLYDGPDASLQNCNGYVMDQEEYDARAEECRGYDVFTEEDGVILAMTAGEYGSYTYLFPVADGIYYMLVIDNTADAEDIISRVTVTAAPAAE